MNELITKSIAFSLQNFPVVMTLIALLIGIFSSFRRRSRTIPDIFLSYLMFFAVGLSGIWGFVMHAFLGAEAAKFIGWANSPFQFEVAVANLGMGIAGIFGFRASKSYRIATMLFTTTFLWGAAYGHVVQMLKTGNFAPGNAGTIFYNDIFMPVLLILFLLTCKQKR